MAEITPSFGPGGSSHPDSELHYRAFPDNDGEISLFAYWYLLKSQWRVIAISALAVMFVTALVCKVALTKVWQATAVLRPVSLQGQQANLSGGMLAGGFTSMGTMSSLLGSTEEGSIANEYMAIMKSYDFTMALLKGHNLTAYISEPHSRWFSWMYSSNPSDWQLYQRMLGRFACSFDPDTGNLALTFVDTDKDMSARILNFYIEDLREWERKQQRDSASAALRALGEEARSVEDPMLQSHLYQLSAMQLEMAKAATAQSDFAFKKIQSPVAPNRAYSPRTSIDMILAGIGTVFVISAFFILRDAMGRAREEYLARTEAQLVPTARRASLGKRRSG